MSNFQILLLVLSILILLVCAFFIVMLALKKNDLCLAILKNVWAKIKNLYRDVVKMPLYILSHPIQGYTEFKNDKKGKMYAAIVILLLYVLSQIISYNYLGPVINTNNPMKFNSVLIIIYGVLPVILISVANWAITTLFDGKGKMKEIFMMICYAYFPLAVCSFLKIILSNFVTTDEVMFITIIDIIGWVGTGYMVFMGLVVIHEYGVFKTIVSILGTVVAVLIILFIALLIFDLSQQVYGFLYSLYKEIMTRFMA